jgi:excisionase family DNA binding protein
MPIPDFLTVTEAAQVLRIGRTAAYALAARYEHTAGAEGLPVIRIGKQLRVPRARLEQLAGGRLLAPEAP